MLLLLKNYEFIKYINAPTQGQASFQRPGTFYMLSVIEMHALVMFYCTIILCCVCGLLFEVWYRFRESKNPYPTKRIRDNWIIEWIFVIVPYFIVFSLILPSWALLYASNEPHDCDCTIKAIGYQWYWNYEVHNFPLWIRKGYDWRLFWICIREGVKWKTTYLSFNELNSLNSSLFNNIVGNHYLWVYKKTSYYMLSAYVKYHNILNGNTGYMAYIPYKVESVTVSTEDLLPGHLRLLEVSKAILLPLQRWIRLNVTGFSVLHSWAIPAFGVKIDGVPGRLNTGYLFILYEGLFYGQCSEFCGQYHYRMSIVVKSLNPRS